MRPFEAIGTRLLAGTAVTDIVGDNIYHGDKPEGKGFPTINYFEISHNILAKGVYENVHYQISCRAETPGAAQDLAYEVMTIFHNMQEPISTFDVNNGTVLNKLLIKEPDTKVYHVPVDIRLCFDSSENT